MRMIGYFCDTSGCCGVRQVCDFSEEPGEWMRGDIEVEEEDEEKLCKNFFKKLRKQAEKGYVHQIWFVKQRDFDGNDNEHYEREPLRQLIAGMEGVMDLGEYRNPNTGNMIHGYQWRA